MSLVCYRCSVVAMIMRNFNVVLVVTLLIYNNEKLSFVHTVWLLIEHGGKTFVVVVMHDCILFTLVQRHQKWVNS